MALQYREGIDPTNPVLVALESEIDRLNKCIEFARESDEWTREDFMALMYKRNGLVNLYAQFVQPFETYVLSEVEV